MVEEGLGGLLIGGETKHFGNVEGQVRARFLLKEFVEVSQSLDRVG